MRDKVAPLIMLLHSALPLGGGNYYKLRGPFHAELDLAVFKSIPLTPESQGIFNWKPWHQTFRDPEPLKRSSEIMLTSMCLTDLRKALSMVVLSYSPSTWGTEAGGL